MNKDDEELIDILPQSKQKVHKFLDILLQKGPIAYDELVKSLIAERTQIFLVEELNKAFEEKKKRFDVLMKTIPTTTATDNVQCTSKPEPVDQSVISQNSLDSIPASKQQHSKTAISAQDAGKLEKIPSLDTENLRKPHTEIIPTSMVQHSYTSISALGVDTDKLPMPHMAGIPTTNDERDCGVDVDKCSDGTCSEDGNLYSAFQGSNSDSKV